MTILPEGIPAVHPAWCDQQHAEDYPVHTADIGDQDIELGAGRDLSVGLFQRFDDQPQVWLCEHRAADTAVTALTAEQAAELARRLLTAASALLDGGPATYPYRRPLGEGNSGPGGPL